MLQWPAIQELDAWGDQIWWISRFLAGSRRWLLVGPPTISTCGDGPGQGQDNAERIADPGCHDRAGITVPWRHIELHLDLLLGMLRETLIEYFGMRRGRMKGKPALTA
jgi:hypothetical protein